MHRKAGNKNPVCRYATAGLDNQLFVSKYLIELPDMNVLTELLEHFIDARKTPTS